MFHRLLESVKREASGERALETVRALARHHRVQSSPGYDRASEWLAERLESHGLEIEVESVPGDGRTRLLGQLMPEGWACERALAMLVDGSRRERLCDAEAEPLSVVLRSAPARGRYPLVAIAGGAEAAHYQGVDVRGTVVLTRGDVHAVHRLAVLERGAAGILTDTRRLVPPVRDAHDETDAINYTSFWWEGDEPRGWGFVVAPEVGDRLRERLAQGAGLELEVEIASRAFPTAIPLLSARLRGASPAEEVVVVSHLCHPQPSANDNASGAAANLETARTLAALAGRGELGPLERSLRFLWVPELTGTYAFFAGDPTRAAGIVAALNLDMVGEDQERCGSTFLLEHPPCFAGSFAEPLLARIRDQAVDWVRSYSGPGHYSMTRMGEVPYGGGSDHAVFVDPAVGVPCPMLIQWPDRFYHSSHDTPDKTDPRSLELAVRCAATYAGFLAGASALERDWLLANVARSARRRLLAAADSSEALAVERERVRGRAALASLSRLGTPDAVLTAAMKALEDFAAREIGHTPATQASADPALARVPRRRLRAPLPFPRRLLPGWGQATAEARERWRAAERSAPETASEVVWMACDGRRSLAEIERLARIEVGDAAAGFVAPFFEAAAGIGLAEWATAEEATCNPSARDTAGR